MTGRKSDAASGRDSTHRPRVALVKCPSYDTDVLSRAIKLSFELLGGRGGLLNPGMRIFVKINHLSPYAPPDRAICTHPAFVREVLRVLLELDVRLTVGDDVRFGRGDPFVESGYRKACAEVNVPLVNLREFGFLRVPIPGHMLKEVYIAKPVLESDFVLNLPKLKTHSFTIFTGAIKNIYGLIPGGLRLDGHRCFARNDLFSRMLVDVFSAVPRQLTLMDAVVGMEGEGPSAGNPRKIGLIISGTDAVAVDAVASHVVGYDPMDIFTISEAQARGLGIGDIGRIEVVGERIEEVKVRNFRHSSAASSLFRRRLPSLLYAYVSGQLILTPEVVPARCTACKDCIRICPAETIELVNGKARINEAGCIHCLCCHEVCSFRSIRLKQRLLGKIASWASRLQGALIRHS